MCANITSASLKCRCDSFTNKPNARPGWVLSLLAAGLTWSSVGAGVASADTVSFTDDGTFQTAKFVQGGLSVTGRTSAGAPGLVHLQNLNGLGIVGGDDLYVDGSESVTFQFDEVAANVSYVLLVAGNTDGDNLLAERTVEAFSADGFSLGTVSQSNSSSAVSSLFGGQLISKFVLKTADVDFFEVASVTFTPMQYVIRWTAAGSGNWADGGNWDSGVAPLLSARVKIEPSTSLTVTAPSSISNVKSLNIGAPTGGTAVLSFPAGAVLVSDTTVSIANTTGEIDLHGATLLARGGIQIGGTLRGAGLASGNVSGGTGTALLTAYGTLTTGDATSTSGFDFDGSITVGALIGSGPISTLILLDADRALIGNTALGYDSSLKAPNGTTLRAGRQLQALHADIEGKFTNNGAVQSATSAGDFLTFTDDVDGPGSYSGNIIFSDGFSPGASAAAVSMQNAVFDNTATVTIELGGTSRGSQYDAILASGSVSVDGALKTTLINGFTPSAGDSFDILDWASLSGTFATLELPPISNSLQWNASQLYTTGTLLVTLVGDYNANGTVDAADYVVWRKTMGQTGTGLAADGNHSGSVDLGDYDVWRAHFGQLAGSGASVTPVPEPSTWLLFTVAGWALVWRGGSPLVRQSPA